MRRRNSPGPCCCTPAEPESLTYVSVSIQIQDVTNVLSVAPTLHAFTLVDGRGGPIPEDQVITFLGTITGGTFKLTYGAEQSGSISWSSNTATLVSNIQAGLIAMAAFAPGDVVASEIPAIGATATVRLRFSVAFGNASQVGAISSLTGTGTSITAGTSSPSASNVDEWQAVYFNYRHSGPVVGGSTRPSGTFKLGFGGQTTGAITFSPTGSTLRTNMIAALEALPNIGSGNIDVFTTDDTHLSRIHFIGALTGVDAGPITIEDNSLGSIPAGRNNMVPGIEVILKKDGVEEARDTTDANGVVRLPIVHIGTGDWRITTTGHTDFGNQFVLSPIGGDSTTNGYYKLCFI